MIKGLPERLQDLRNKSGLSQKEVAERIGVSPSIVSAYETGERTPRTDVLLSFAQFYGCSMDYLLGVTHEKLIDVSALNEKDAHFVYSVIERLKGNGRY